MNRQTIDDLIQKYGGSRVSDSRISNNRSHYSQPVKYPNFLPQSGPQQLTSSLYDSRTRQTSDIEGQLGKFLMSKSQCQQFLERVKDELRAEQMSLNGFSQNSIRHIHERFHENHQKIRNFILDLLDKAFQKNQKYITEELKKNHQVDPIQFEQVYAKIRSMDHDIKVYLNGLKGPQYKKSIVQVITKDFALQISNLRQLSNSAKDNYIKTMGQVEPDPERIACIQEDLQKLFRISHKNRNLLKNAFFSVLQQKQKQNRQTAQREQSRKQTKQNEKGVFKSIFKFCSSD